MDPVSHFAVGAVVGGAFAPPVARAVARAIRRANKDAAYPVGAAVLCAGLAAMTPDLDVLIRNADYPLLSVKYHRHFTHALALVPLYAALLLPLAWLLFRRTGMSAAVLYLLALLGLATHGLLDSMTNYGTHLFWPFTNARTSWNMISIVDPIFTFTLLGLIIAAVVRKTRRPLFFAAGFMVLYLGMGLYQRDMAEAAMQNLAASRGHTVERYEVKPAFANIILWRAQYVHEGKIYTDAINVLPGLQPKVYTGTSQPLLVADEAWLSRLPPAAQQDVRDFAFFSAGWLGLVPVQEGGSDKLIGDMRFAMLPNQNAPLWAIELSPLPSGHLPFVQLPRDSAPLRKLWAMIVRQD